MQNKFVCFICMQNVETSLKKPKYRNRSRFFLLVTHRSRTTGSLRFRLLRLTEQDVTKPYIQKNLTISLMRFVKDEWKFQLVPVLLPVGARAEFGFRVLKNPKPDTTKK